MIILLVDDDPEDRELFCIALKEIDASVSCVEARNGKEAIKILSGHSALPDIIIIDINCLQWTG